MDRDGTKSGFDLELTRAVSEAVTVPVIASGGVGTLEHLAQGIEEGRADAVLAASVFHFGEITIPQAKRFLAARGIEMRLGAKTGSRRLRGTPTGSCRRWRRTPPRARC